MRLLRCTMVICILTIGLQPMAQDKKAILKQFNNFSSTFEVPKGKTWLIEQVFSSFAAEIQTNENGQSTIVPIRIFIKTFNGDIKTDWEGDRFGPQVFQSNNSNSTIPYPLSLPEGTKISFVIIQGDPGKCKAFDGSAYISYYEISNK